MVTTESISPNRVVSILRDFSPDIEVYSIDESFLRVESVAHLYGGLGPMGQQIRERIRQWTGLPVCVGFGPSKTLAKLANHMAKKNLEFDGVGAPPVRVCVGMSREDFLQILQ
ncbi:MAG: hypothetical protein KIT18_03755 [Burkholderiales bacterium]|nr:hypothetical protein [Burkholderiales bacterium]